MKAKSPKSNLNSTNIIFEKLSNKKFPRYVLTLDVGGTTTQIGIVGIKNSTYDIVYKTEVWTSKIPTIAKLSSELIEFSKKNLGIKISGLGVAVAGAINPLTQKVKTTNNKKTTSLDELKFVANNFGIKKVALLNDFEALAYSINLIAKKDYKTIYKGKKVSKKPVLVIGAGTSIGINILTYNKEKKLYVPNNSEGANSDFVFSGKKEDKLKNSWKVNMIEFFMRLLFLEEGLRTYMNLFPEKRMMRFS